MTETEKQLKIQEEMIEALKFYAEPENYIGAPAGYELVSEAEADAGARAREILLKLGVKVEC